LRKLVVGRYFRRVAPVTVAAMLVALTAAAPASAAPTAFAKAAQPVTAPAQPKPTPAELLQVPQPAQATIIAGIVQNPNSGRCIGVSGILAGIWDCTGNADQWWHWDPWVESCRLSNTGEYLCWNQLRNGNNQCLGVWGASTEPGARAVGYTCNDSWDQLWRLGPADANGNSTLINGNGYYGGRAWVLGVVGGRTDNGAKIVLYWADGTRNQLWHVPF
jgi:hypothetical protein